MPNINLVSISELQSIGFSLDDAAAVIDLRATFGPFRSTESALNSSLPRSALVRLREAIGQGDLDVGADGESAIVLTFQPVPAVTDTTAATATLSFQDRQNVARSVDFDVPFDRQTIHIENNVALGEGLSVEVKDATGQVVSAKSFSGSQVVQASAASVFFATIDVRTLPGLREVRLRFERNGRFVVPGHSQQRFDGYRLLTAIVADAQAAEATALAQSDGPLDAGALDGFVWEVARLNLNGSFEFAHDAQASDDNAPGWAWLLLGPQSAFGFKPDTNLTRPRGDVTITLASALAPGDPTDGTPLVFDEKALIERSDIFGEDIGLNCQPFSNPERILDEKSFSTVLRVSDPEIGSPRPTIRRPIGRFNELEWENNPTLYQARSIAFGHIVDFRVRTRSNGYSLGSAVHSMTLAPRQTRQIVRVDYQRREREARRERTETADRVSQSTLRDRSYFDAVSSELGEWSRGGSNSRVSSGAVGAGFAIPPFVMGGGAATSSATSSSWQRGGRSVAAAERQKLRDAIRQYGDSIRSLESTVVEELSEEESNVGVSEVVRNINYCHALSVVYYEILRHLRVDTEVGGVSECIFVPLEVRPFNDTRIRRHRSLLSQSLTDRDHRLAMRYLDEIQSNFVTGDIPDGARADQPLTSLSGSVFVRFGVTRPTEGDIADEIDDELEKELSQTKRFKELVKKFAFYAPYLGKSPTALAHEILSISESSRDRYFQREVAPTLARAFADRMKLGFGADDSFTELEADFTLASSYRYDSVIRIDFRVRTDGTTTRRQIEELVFLAPPRERFQLPEDSFANVVRATISFSTEQYRRTVRSGDNNLDDLIEPDTGLPSSEGATRTFAVTAYEEQNLRERLQEAYEALERELDENIYFYHKLIWWNMDLDELYTMLDGFSVSASDPRSLASVVERQPIGIMGNSLVFRAAAGSMVDPRFETPEQLLAFYQDELPPADPMRISLPTSGLYAKAHMDECNACEEHAGSHEWVLEQPDPELAELPVSLLASRRGTARDLGPSQLPDTLINLQNAPAAPQPAGLQGVLDAATTNDAFRDMADLSGTQNLAQQGLSTAANLATNFGQAALQLKLAELGADEKAGKKLASAADAAQKAVDKGQMVESDAKNFVRDFASKLSAGSPETRMSIADEAKELSDVIGSSGAATISRTNSDGSSVVSIDKDNASPSNGTVSDQNPIAPVLFDVALIPQPNKHSCWAASMAMIEGYRQDVEASMSLPFSAEELADEVGFSLEQSYGWDRLEAVKDYFGFEEIRLSGAQYPTASQWRQWLADHGPLYVTVSGNPTHAIVVRGISGDSTPAGSRLDILNPWDIEADFDNDETDFNPPNTGRRLRLSVSDLNQKLNGGDLSELRFYENWRILFMPSLSPSVPLPTPGQAATCPNLPTLTELRDEAIAVARQEALHWTDNTVSEMDANALPRLREFWLTVQGPRSDNMVVGDPNSFPEASQRVETDGGRPWSAVFISWCYVQSYALRNPDWRPRVPGRELLELARCLRRANLFSAQARHVDYVDRAVATGNYAQFDHATTPVEVGDWIHSNRTGGTHVDMVTNVFSSQNTAGSTFNWAVAVGGNIARPPSARGVTAGFKIHALDTNGLLTNLPAATDFPDTATLQAAVNLTRAQITSFRNRPNDMRGLIRLA